MVVFFTSCVVEVVDVVGHHVKYATEESCAFRTNHWHKIHKSGPTFINSLASPNPNSRHHVFISYPNHGVLVLQNEVANTYPLLSQQEVTLFTGTLRKAS